MVAIDDSYPNRPIFGLHNAQAKTTFVWDGSVPQYLRPLQILPHISYLFIDYLELIHCYAFSVIKEIVILRVCGFLAIGPGFQSFPQIFYAKLDQIKLFLVDREALILELACVNSHMSLEILAEPNRHFLQYFNFLCLLN